MKNSLSEISSKAAWLPINTSISIQDEVFKDIFSDLEEYFLNKNSEKLNISKSARLEGTLDDGI